MSRPVVIWEGSKPPTAAELRAIGRACRAGLVNNGDRVACVAGELAELENPTPELEAARGRIALLKFEQRKARERTRAKQTQIRKRRAASRPKLSAKLRRLRANWREQINARIAELRGKHRAVWQHRLEAAKLPTAEAAAKLEAERDYQRSERRERAAQRKKTAGQPKSRRVARFHKAESDYRVEQNIDPELVPVWRAVKNQIRTAVAGKTRTEAFKEWVSENRREVDALREAWQSAELGELEAELAAQEAAYFEGAA